MSRGDIAIYMENYWWGRGNPMRAMLIDDEHLPLMHLKKMLERDIGGVEVIGTYSDPLEAVEIAQVQKPDVVFLDINMPEISGLEIGEQLQACVPGAEIVFVTGYDRYAVDAFELCALDYVMKPVQLERLQKTMERLKGKIAAEPEKAQENERPVVISCFNQIKLELPDKEPHIIKWRTAKSLELFAYLLHNRNRVVDKESLIELLWPDCDITKGVTQLYTTIYLIRQTLKRNGLGDVSISKGNLEAGYKLTTGSAKVDTEEWEAHLKQLSVPTRQTIDEHEQVLDMYKGDYLGNYDFLWAEHERERLRRLYLGHAENVSAFYMEEGNLEAAIHVNQRMQQLYPLEEASYFSLMKLYDALGNRAAVEEQFWLLSLRWEQELDAQVNPDIAFWYDHWKRSESS